MAHVHFKLSDELVRDAREAGLSIARLTEQALRDALAGRGTEPETVTPQTTFAGREVDDGDRYQQGRAIGERWVSAFATLEEIAGLAELRSSRWRDLGIDTTTHSLGELLVESGELEPGSDGKAWLERGPFAEGLIDAAVGAALS